MPNAKHVFSRAEYAHWSGPAGQQGFNAGVVEDIVLPVIAAGQAEIVEGPTVVGDVPLLCPTPGHSPGHVSVALEPGGAQALFSGDLMHHPIQVYHPAWNSRSCGQADAGRASWR